MVYLQIGEIGGHDEIMFDDECCFFRVDNKSFNYSGADDSLF
jgi:hypothetical protein